MTQKYWVALKNKRPVTFPVDFFYQLNCPWSYYLSRWYLKFFSLISEALEFHSVKCAMDTKKVIIYQEFVVIRIR